MEIFNLQSESYWRDIILETAKQYRKCPQCILQNGGASYNDYPLTTKKSFEDIKLDVKVCEKCKTAYLIQRGK